MFNSRKLLLKILLLVPTLFLVLSHDMIAQAGTVKLNKYGISLNVGDTETLKLSGTKKAITWSSNNKTVATVSSKGKVTAKEVGNAIITATVEGKKYKCNVSVLEIYISNETININLSESISGNSFNFLHMRGYAKEVDWINSDDTVVSIDEIGVLTAHKIGTVTISTTIKNKEYSCVINVTDYSNEEKMAAYGLLMLNPLLKDPSSMSINGIYYINGKQEVVVIDYSATNSLGGKVRSYAVILLTDEILRLGGYTLETDDLGYVYTYILDTKPSTVGAVSLNIDNILKLKSIKAQNDYTYYY